MSALTAVRRRVELRAYPDLPLLDVRAVLVGAGTSFVLYLLLGSWLTGGATEILASMPVGIRIGALLLASTATRLTAGWFAARRYRNQHGLPARLLAVPSAMVGALLGWTAVFLLAMTAGPDVSVAAVLADAVRWPVEAGVGALIAVPGLAAVSSNARNRAIR
jgi:hypothetical protein